MFQINFSCRQYPAQWNDVLEVSLNHLIASKHATFLVTSEILFSQNSPPKCQLSDFSSKMNVIRKEEKFPEVLFI